MAQLILLLGISAAGKTTLGQAVAESAPVTYVYSATEKFDLLRPGETLNLLDQRRTYEVNQQLFDKLLARQGALLVDTHATYPVGDGFVKLTPPAACPRIGGIVFLEAEIETIRARRLARGRTHEATDPATLVREGVEEREEVSRLQRTFGIAVCHIDTTRMTPGDGVDTVTAFIDRLARPTG